MPPESAMNNQILVTRGANDQGGFSWYLSAATGCYAVFDVATSGQGPAGWETARGSPRATGALRAGLPALQLGLAG
ncbi:MAG: hypothetical protein ACLQFR_32060 [Streptosporangiaceae bacterium]